MKVFHALGNERRLNLFRYIASNGGWFPKDLITTQQLTNKQFYSGMAELKRVGLIRKTKGKWYITGYGKVVAKCVETIQRLDEVSWIVRALEHTKEELTPSEQTKAAKLLISDPYIREVVLAG